MQLKKILVIGVGSIGERHVRCFQHTGSADVSIVEINPRLRSEVAERHGVSQSFEDLNAALNCPFDAAVICTPAHLHIPIAIQCAQRGISLLIEKPLSVNFDGVEELKRIIREKRIVASVAYVLRCHPILAAMRETLLSERFGRPVQIVGVGGQHFPTYRPAYREIYYANRALGGGAIQDALTHLMNAAEWLVGPVTRLAADADHLVLPGVEVEDTVHVIARHGTVMGAYSLNQHQAANEFSLTVVCDRGTLRFEGHNHRYRSITDPGGEWRDETFVPLERDTVFIAQAKQFLAALDGGLEACSLADGEQTLRVNLAVASGAETGLWINIEPASRNGR